MSQTKCYSLQDAAQEWSWKHEGDIETEQGETNGFLEHLCDYSAQQALRKPSMMVDRPAADPTSMEPPFAEVNSLSQCKVTHWLACKNLGTKSGDQDTEHRQQDIHVHKLHVLGKRAWAGGSFSNYKTTFGKTVDQCNKKHQATTSSEFQDNMIAKHLRQLSLLESPASVQQQAVALTAYPCHVADPCESFSQSFHPSTLRALETDFVQSDCTEESDHDFEWHVHQATLACAAPPSRHAEHFVDLDSEATDFDFLI